MDFSTLSLANKHDPPSGSLFGMGSTLGSVNVSYATAKAHYEYGGTEDADDVELQYIRPTPVGSEHTSPAGSPIDTELSSKISSATNKKQASDDGRNKKSENDNDSPHANTGGSTNKTDRKNDAIAIPDLVTDHTSDTNADSGDNSPSGISPSQSQHNFPLIDSKDQQETSTSPARSLRRRARNRSSISLASVECQNFVNSLKEPKYAKPLSADEISWIFQDFYRKLREDVLGSEYEMLTAEEMEDRKSKEANIDNILDRAEKAVTGGELHSKLFTLGDHYDESLELRIDAIRKSEELKKALRKRLDLKSELIESIDLTQINTALSKLGRETSPRGKLTAIVKSLQIIGDSLPKDAKNADTILPLFVWSLTESGVCNWWQNFAYIQRFRRNDAVKGQAEYCLTSFEAAIHIMEEFTIEEVPEEVDAALFAKPLRNPGVSRQRSSSQSSRNSSTNSTAGASFSQRLGETLNSYKTMIVHNAPNVNASPPPRRMYHQIVDSRFLGVDADSLTISDVRVLLREYKRLAEYVESRRM